MPRRLIDRLDSAQIIKRFIQTIGGLRSCADAVSEMLDFETVMINGVDALVNDLSLQVQHHLGIDNRRGKGKRDGDASLIANHLGYLARRQFKTRIDQAESASAEIKHGAGGKFDITFAGGENARGNSDGRVSIYRATEIDGIAAHIHQRTPGQRCLQANIMRMRGNRYIE